MKNPLTVLEQSTLTEFKATFPNIEAQINDVFVDTIGIFRGTLLHAAIYNRKSSFVRYFLKLGANIESKAGMGHTPLYEAVLARSVKIAKLLIDAGADISTTNRMDKNLLSALCTMRYGDRSMTKVKLLDYLLCQQVSIDRKDEDGRTPLYDFVQWDEPLLLKILLDFGARIDVSDAYGYTPLHVAAARNQSNVCKTLLQRGADMNAKNQYGWTALDVAILYNREETINYFRFAGANENFNHALMLLKAVHENDEASALQLIAHQDDYNLYDAHPLSLLRLAIRNGMNDLVAQILTQKEVDTKGALNMAAFKRNLPVLKLLLDDGVNANEIFLGNSALYQVVSLGKKNETATQIIDLLLEQGCVYNAEELGSFGRLGDLWEKG